MLVSQEKTLQKSKMDLVLLQHQILYQANSVLRATCVQMIHIVVVELKIMEDIVFVKGHAHSVSAVNVQVFDFQGTSTIY